MKTRSSVLFATAGLALCLSFSESAAIDSAPKNSESADSQTESDIASYAREFGTSIGEAARRSKILAARGNLAIDLRNEFESRFAGLYLEHVPDLRVVVRLTGNSPVSSRLAVNKEGTIPIVFLMGARATLEELEAILDTHQKALYSKIPALQGLYADERTGDIVLVVHAIEVESKAYDAEVPALSKMLGHPVRFVFEASPSQETASAEGGALTTSCTTGFSVRETATDRKGILTATHCANAQVFLHPDAYITA